MGRDRGRVPTQHGGGRKCSPTTRLPSQPWPEFIGDADAAHAWVDYLRQGGSPATADAVNQIARDIDVRDVLPAIHVPTLVVHGERDHLDVEGARWTASQIAGARFVELPGQPHIPDAEGFRKTGDEIERFLGELSARRADEDEPDRVLATILFTDIVESSERLAAVGDHAWRQLLDRYHSLVRQQLLRFRGREVDTAGDGFFASFDGPARAIRCACAILDGIGELDLQARAGLHTGECELLGDKLAGIAVHTGARVASHAQPGEVLVSSTVRDLVAGSGIVFEDRGVHDLKGIPGEWRLHAVAL